MKKNDFKRYVRKPKEVLGKKLENGNFLMKSGKYQWIVEKDAFHELYEAVEIANLLIEKGVA